MGSDQAWQVNGWVYPGNLGKLLGAVTAQSRRRKVTANCLVKLEPHQVQHAGRALAWEDLQEGPTRAAPGKLQLQETALARGSHSLLHLSCQGGREVETEQVHAP